LFLLSLGLIVLFMPKDLKFKYEYHKGKPWLHSDLIAPFDFSIYKTDEELELEKKEVLANTYPFFVYDNSVADAANIKFSRAFESFLSSNGHVFDEKRKEKYIQTGKQILHEIFDKGIVSNWDTKLFDIQQRIYIQKNNTTSLINLSDISSVTEANEILKSRVENSKDIEPDILLPLLQSVLNHNIYYDETTSTTNKDLLLNRISLTRGMVQNGERIIAKGELITHEKFRIIESLKIEYSNLHDSSYRYYMMVLGQLSIISLLLLVVFLFLYNFRKSLFDNNKKLFFIVLQVVLMVFITKLIVGYDISLLYAIPVCITPIIIRAFFDTRLAIFIHVVTVIIISSFAPNSYEFLMYHLVAGIVAVLSIINLSKRSQLFFTALYIFGTYMVFYISFMLIFDGSLKNTDTNFIIQFAVSAVLNLLAFPLIFFYEKIFGYPTDFSLMELSNTNNPLLRELASKAAGTFQHAIQVANLGEEAAYQTDANPLLVRAGALYHDVGKIFAPAFFTENHIKNNDPHQDLSYKESAGIIIGHVLKGIELARKHKIPEYIIDFIRTHHGTKKVGFFYAKHMNEDFPKETATEDFSYRGPLPFSKETAILMMADAVEAASRSLNNYDDISIDALVDNIIDSQISEKQFIKCDLTFKDVSIIRKVFKKRLKNIYHVRIAYPEA